MWGRRGGGGLAPGFGVDGMDEEMREYLEKAKMEYLRIKRRGGQKRKGGRDGRDKDTDERGGREEGGGGGL